MSLTAKGRPGRDPGRRLAARGTFLCRPAKPLSGLVLQAAYGAVASRPLPFEGPRAFRGTAAEGATKSPARSRFSTSASDMLPLGRPRRPWDRRLWGKIIESNELPEACGRSCGRGSGLGPRQGPGIRVVSSRRSMVETEPVPLLAGHGGRTCGTRRGVCRIRTGIGKPHGVAGSGETNEGTCRARLRGVDPTCGQSVRGGGSGRERRIPGSAERRCGQTSVGGT